ncbi:hypothetical protein Ppro_0898 [Pelobacter propionicus DSM 2379]|uniref:Uncharacterized protein n=1 Tax=Pelobacter propionicus (strain DSM 2379 / NBRC 103807 / OttBd1) TaxID=338966 RepID=A1AMF7_PELPD|nr:hypothetical protein Ppro_0898 [Pelobacter propionicus DSM 2379]
MYASYPFHACGTLLLVALPHVVFLLALIFSLLETNAPPFEKGGLGGICWRWILRQIPLNPPFPKGDFVLYRYWLKINANRVLFWCTIIFLMEEGV